MDIDLRGNHNSQHHRYEISILELVKVCPRFAPLPFLGYDTSSTIGYRGDGLINNPSQSQLISTRLVSASYKRIPSIVENLVWENFIFRLLRFLTSHQFAIEGIVRNWASIN